MSADAGLQLAQWRDWPPDAKRRLLARLRDEAQRRRPEPEVKPLPDSPGALAAQVTAGRELHAPHLALIDRELIRASEAGSARVVINVGPRQGKSRRLIRFGVPWWLQRHPDDMVAVVTHGAELVEEHSRFVRDLLEDYDLGIRPRRDSRAVDRWALEDHAGGMLAIGLDGSFTGRGGNLVLLDDLIKNAEQAESKRYRERTWRAWRETVYPRLEPGASVFVINTRWHEDDLSGRLEREEPGVWTFLRIPTLAEPGDLLGRRPGEPLWPARFPLEVVLEQQQVMGRAFNAQHQQRPSAPTGGVWDEETIRAARIDLADCPDLPYRLVALDPSASEDAAGDECGIVVTGRDAQGRGYVLADLSGRMDPDSWARVALLAAVEHDCDIAYESNLTPVFIRRVLTQGWAQLQRDAAVLGAGNGHGEDALALLLEAEGRPEYSTRDITLLRRLPALMPALKPVRAKVGKVLRAEPVAQLFRQRRAFLVGVFPQLEGQMTSWKPTDSDSPDRLDAMVHGVVGVVDVAGPAQTAKVSQVRLPSVRGRR